MNYLSVEKLSKRYGLKLLFEEVSFGLERGQKMALIARNGSGKSTLLKCIVGQETADSGIVTLRNGITMGYLDQQAIMSGSHSIVDEILDGPDELSSCIREYEHAQASKDTNKLQRAIDKMEELKAWDHEARMKALLHRLGLTDLEQPVDTLSGGQQKRLALAKVLSTDPDVLILDEPTNHLDMDMIEWLQEEMSAPGRTVLLVTHDRYFLDRVCDEIVELEEGSLNRFKGNYSYYLERKAQADEVRTATSQKLNSLMRSELEWVRKQPKARGTKSKSRLDAFSDLSDRASKKYDNDEVTLEVKVTRLGGKVIEVRNLGKSFGEKRIVEKFSYSFKRGDRIGMVGPNGVGKSTFIDLITGATPPDTGKVVIGETVILGHYDQQGLPATADGKRIVEVVREIAEVIPLAKGKKLTAAQLLERFLFDRDKQFQYVSTLSGGERRRLYLCTVLMKNPNVLILDEPTNDLDIQTMNVLEDMLLDLDACILVVSHDRFFVDKLCDRLLLFKGDGKIKEFIGNYNKLKALQKAEHAAKSTKKKPTDKKGSKPSGKITYAERLELKRLDKDIPAQEKLKAELTASFSDPDVDHEEIARRSLELEKVMAQIDRMTERWMELSEKESG